MSKRTTNLQSRGRDRLLGLLIIAFSFGVCSSASLWAKQKTVPQSAPAPAPRSIEGLTGFPTKVRPFEVFELAKSRTERPLFVGMVAENVKGDGTQDFSAPRTRLKFVFQSPPNMGAQPPREGGSLPLRSYCGKQEVTLTKQGLGEKKDHTTQPCGSHDPIGLKLPIECSIEDVLALIQHGNKRAPLRHLKIEYLQTQAGAAYVVSRRGKKQFTLLASDCSTMLKGKAARGRIP